MKCLNKETKNSEVRRKNKSYFIFVIKTLLQNFNFLSSDKTIFKNSEKNWKRKGGPCVREWKNGLGTLKNDLLLWPRSHVKIYFVKCFIIIFTGGFILLHMKSNPVGGFAYLVSELITLRGSQCFK